MFPTLNSDREPLPAETQERATQKAYAGGFPAGPIPAVLLEKRLFFLLPFVKEDTVNPAT